VGLWHLCLQLLLGSSTRLSSGLISAQMEGTSGRHCVSRCAGLHVRTPSVYGGIWLCAGLRAGLFEVSLFCLPLGILCRCICIYGKRCHHHLLPLLSSCSLCSADSWAFPAERCLPRAAKRGGVGGWPPASAPLLFLSPGMAAGWSGHRGHFFLSFFLLIFNN